MKYFIILLVLFAGCKATDVCQYKPDIPYLCPTGTPTPTPAPVEVYTVVRGQHVDKEMSVPASLTFDMTGKVASDEMIEAHLAWAVDSGQDWNGGNPVPASIYSASAKDYKLKCGAFGERRFTVAWDASKTYTVELKVEKDATTETILLEGKVIAQTTITAAASDKVVLSYGWPPTKRNGAEGAKLKNIMFTELK